MTKLKTTLSLFACYSLLNVAMLFVASPVCAQPGMGPDMKLVEKFDADENGILNAEERLEAIKFIESERAKQNTRGRRGGRRGGGRNRPKGTEGLAVAVNEVAVEDAAFFEPSVFRTIFLEFDEDDWEKQLEIFKPTDVEIAAKMTVDGKPYPDVGVSFRGASSFFMIPEGLKRSLNISMDFVDDDQALYGYKSLNLLNVNGDASMMSSFLYSSISSKRIATPKVNYVRVVINGRSWGVYVNSQQFNKTFLAEHFENGEGARWKVPGNPRGDGGLRYLGEELEEYRERFEIKSKDKQKSWDALINLCKVLNETPQDELKEKLEPILDVQGCLWFLAVDVALSNSDGYWTRASDYNIFMNEAGKFHILPHDMNEAFRGGSTRGGGGRTQKGKQGGRSRRSGGGGGFGRGGGPTLDPLYGVDQERMPLRSVLLNHPEYQQQYLMYLREIAEMLKWDNIGPQVAMVRELLKEQVENDTRKLSSLEAFLQATNPDEPDEDSSSLRAFAEKRSAFLLNHEKIKALPK